ncbi:MAG: MFS transporter [Oscillospiraceae bacterium]|nr:MFS transporter [Oscillospiraceae bacterium]
MKSNQNSKPQIFNRSFWLICVAMLFSRMVMQMQGAVFPLYVTTVLGHSKSIAGFMSSSAAIAAIIIRPNIGRLIDKGNIKLLFAIGSFMYIAGVLGSGIFTSVPLLVLFRFIYGIGQATQGTSGSSAATRLIPESHMREGIGYYGMTASITQAIGPSVALMLIAIMGYRNQFITSTAFMLLASIIGMTVNMSPQKTEPVEMTQTDEIPNVWWQKFVEKTALPLALIMLTTDMAQVTIGTFLIIRTRELGINNIGLFFTTQAVFAICIRLFGRKLTSGSLERKAFGATLIGIAAVFVLIFLSTKLWQLVIIAAFYGLCTGNYYVTLQTMMLMNAPPERRGIANSTYFLSNDIGVAIGAPLWGLLADNIGTKYIYLLAPIFPIAALIYFTRLSKKLPTSVE